MPTEILADRHFYPGEILAATEIPGNLFVNPSCQVRSRLRSIGDKSRSRDAGQCNDAFDDVAGVSSATAGASAAHGPDLLKFKPAEAQAVTYNRIGAGPGVKR